MIEKSSLILARSDAFCAPRRSPCPRRPQCDPLGSDSQGINREVATIRMKEVDRKIREYIFEKGGHNVRRKFKSAY